MTRSVCVLNGTTSVCVLNGTNSLGQLVQSGDQLFDCVRATQQPLVQQLADHSGHRILAHTAFSSAAAMMHATELRPSVAERRSQGLSVAEPVQRSVTSRAATLILPSASLLFPDIFRGDSSSTDSNPKRPLSRRGDCDTGSACGSESSTAT